jgi:5-methylcytosine-specific restriction protein A
MPYKPKRPCRHPGCAKLTDSLYCEGHAALHARQYAVYERNPETNKRYGRQWKKLRSAFLSAHPLFEICKRDGKLTPATLVHHKVRLSKGGTNDRDNLMALCDSCPSRLHAEHGDYF